MAAAMARFADPAPDLKVGPTSDAASAHRDPENGSEAAAAAEALIRQQHPHNPINEAILYRPPCYPSRSRAVRETTEIRFPARRPRRREVTWLRRWRGLLTPRPT